MTIAVAGDKGLDRRGAVIFAQNPGDGRKQHALAVGARAISEEQRMLAGDAGEGVAEYALKVGYERGVAACNPIEEGEEARTVAARSDRRDLGHIVVGPVRAGASGAKVDDVLGVFKSHGPASH